LFAAAVGCCLVLLLVLAVAVGAVVAAVEEEAEEEEEEEEEEDEEDEEDEEEDEEEEEEVESATADEFCAALLFWPLYWFVATGLPFSLPLLSSVNKVLIAKFGSGNCIGKPLKKSWTSLA
jgi:Na+-transporting methylmalonyl-CoA/oxaloacetate decarboxylase gamma subunit